MLKNPIDDVCSKILLLVSGKKKKNGSDSYTYFAVEKFNLYLFSQA